jgi:hypothetical protein
LRLGEVADDLESTGRNRGSWSQKNGMELGELLPSVHPVAPWWNEDLTALAGLQLEKQGRPPPDTGLVQHEDR